MPISKRRQRPRDRPRDGSRRLDIDVRMTGGGGGGDGGSGWVVDPTHAEYRRDRNRTPPTNNAVNNAVDSTPFR